MSRSQLAQVLGFLKVEEELPEGQKRSALSPFLLQPPKLFLLEHDGRRLGLSDIDRGPQLGEIVTLCPHNFTDDLGVTHLCHGVAG